MEGKSGPSSWAGVVWWAVRDADGHSGTMCPPWRRTADPNIEYKHLLVHRFPTGMARKRPSRSLYYEISRRARRPWGGLTNASQA
eukprot:263936-Pyramimonas_sp.AAC.1